MVHEGRILFEEVNEVTELHYYVKYPWWNNGYSEDSSMNGNILKGKPSAIMSLKTTTIHEGDK